MANFCGGIKLNPDVFEIRKGVITLVTAHSDDPLEETVTTCSQLWDAIVFEAVNLDGKHKMITAAGVDTEIPTGNPIKSNCGIYFDSRFFNIEGKVLSYTERHLIEVLVNPPEAEYTITVEDEAEPGTPIEPIEGLHNVYPMDDLDGSYLVTVTAEGYDDFEQRVEASEGDNIVQATLTPSAD